MRAVISVADKREVVAFARGLVELGVEIFSTGGTLRTLTEAGVAARSVSDLTKFPEILDGRVKTLHPAIHGGILFRRDHAEDVAQLAELGIEGIDLVVVNLYPFRETIRQANVTLQQALEQIDIGGPTLLRAAAKNFPYALPLVDPADYQPMLQALQAGSIDLLQRRALAAKAFAHTASYDSAIATYLQREAFPATLTLAWRKQQDLRYGENPHQSAAFYCEEGDVGGAIAGARQLQGKELSFNNILDADAALSVVRSFAAPAATIIKHNNPCGLALSDDLRAAHAAARAGDPVSAYGGIVGFNRPVDGAVAEALSRYFYEIILAPGFDEEAQAIFARKANLRVLEVDTAYPRQPSLDFRRVSGGLLVQTEDVPTETDEGWRVVTSHTPNEEQWAALRFAWQACAFAKSNAILLAQGQAVVGLGCGQPSRVDATMIAIRKAGERARGSVLASDAFFPKPDNIELAAEAGVVAIVQPGGSQGDDEAIAAAERAGIAMVFTGRRHFRH